MLTRKPTHHRPPVPPFGPGPQLACRSQILSVRAVFAVVWIAVWARLEQQRDHVQEEHAVAALRTLLAAEIVAAGTTKVEELLIVEEESQRQKMQSN